MTTILSSDTDGGYVVQMLELPGAISQGNTIEEALDNVREAAALYLTEATPEELAASEETAYLLKSPENARRLLASIARLESRGCRCGEKDA